MSEPTSENFELRWPEEPERVLRGRCTMPAGELDQAGVPFVMILHGFKGFMDWGFFPELARRLARAGYAAIAFNTSGSGIGPDLQNFTEEEAFARATYSQQLEDIERVRDHVASGAFQGVDPSRGAILGHSRGGAMALVHAAERGDYRAVVTWASIDTTRRFDPQTRNLWREQGHVPVVNARTGQTLRIDLIVLEDAEAQRERLDIRAAAARLRTPALLIHGTADESVHPRALERLAGGMDHELHETLRIEGAGHTFGARHPLEGWPGHLDQALEATVAWLETHIETGMGTS